VFFRKIECLRGFLVNIRAREAQNAKKQTQGNLNLFLSILKLFAIFPIFLLSDEALKRPKSELKISPIHQS
jgi:hypothetical protein